MELLLLLGNADGDYYGTVAQCCETAPEIGPALAQCRETAPEIGPAQN